MADGDKAFEERDIIIPTGQNECNKLGPCEVCNSTLAKYTCPRCEVKTCSLNCCKKHKEELKCNGQRDKTKFIPLNKFTNLDMLSDYRVLEETTRRAEEFKTSSKHLGRPDINQNGLPSFLHKLRVAANKRKINLKFLPKTFVKHKENSTRLDFKTNLISWHIEWIFVNSFKLKVQEPSVPENKKLSLVLGKYFDNKEVMELQQRLQYYQAAGMVGVKLLLRAEQKGPNTYYEIDPTSTLEEILPGKTVVEFPTILVVLKDHNFGQKIIPEDDEVEFEDKSNNQEKNYLFLSSESSEGE